MFINIINLQNSISEVTKFLKCSFMSALTSSSFQIKFAHCSKVPSKVPQNLQIQQKIDCHTCSIQLIQDYRNMVRGFLQVSSTVVAVVCRAPCHEPRSAPLLLFNVRKRRVNGRRTIFPSGVQFLLRRIIYGSQREQSIIVPIFYGKSKACKESTVVMLPSNSPASSRPVFCQLFIFEFSSRIPEGIRFCPIFFAWFLF